MKTLRTYLEMNKNYYYTVFFDCFPPSPPNLLIPLGFCCFRQFLWLLPQTKLRIISVPIEQSRKKYNTASIGLTLFFEHRNFPFHTLFAEHRIDFQSHVMLSGGDVKEQKSKQKTLPEHYMMSFLCSKMMRQIEEKQKQKQKQTLPSF